MLLCCLEGLYSLLSFLSGGAYYLERAVSKCITYIKTATAYLLTSKASSSAVSAVVKSITTLGLPFYNVNNQTTWYNQLSHKGF